MTKLRVYSLSHQQGEVMRLFTGVLVAVLVTLPQTTMAQSTSGTTVTFRPFVEVNFVGGVNSLAEERTFSSQFVKFSELATVRSTYPSPSNVGAFSTVEVGGGVMLMPALGLGVLYSDTAYENSADLATTVPDPIFLRAAASATGVTQGRLERRERATHVFVAWTPLRLTRTELRFIGGPSFFRYKATMVQDVLYTQTSNPSTPQNHVTIDGFTAGEVSDGGAGFHVGGDFAYFLTNAFGITGGARYSYGTVTVSHEPLSALSQEIRVGSTVGFIGVRVRFGT